MNIYFMLSVLNKLIVLIEILNDKHWFYILWQCKLEYKWVEIFAALDVIIIKTVYLGQIAIHKPR